jgi:hypothetical protein
MKIKIVKKGIPQGSKKPMGSCPTMVDEMES